MWKKIVALFKPPAFIDDEKKTQASELINSISLSILAATLLYTIFARVAVPFNLYIVVVPLMLMQVGLLFMLRRGHVKLTGTILVIGIWLILFYASYINGGDYAPAFSGYIIVVMIAAFLLGPRWGLFTAGASVIAGVILILLANKGILPEPKAVLSLFTVLLAQITYFIVAAVLLGFATRNIGQAIEVVRSSEERYRLITSVMSDYAFFTQFGLNGKISDQWIEGAFESMTGYAPTEYFSRGGWNSILHPDDREKDQQDMIQLHANKKVISEIRIIRKDGGIRWVRSYAHPKWDERKNQLSGVYGAVQDITEQKQIEISLRKRESILEIVAHTSNLFLKTNDWKTELGPFLERLGKTMNASHAYVFENHLLENGELGKSIRYEWSAPSVPSDLGDPKYANKPLNAPEIAAWYGLMKRGLPYIGDRHNVPRSEMDFLRNDGIESLLDVPIFVNGNWWGIIGFDDVLNEREWTHAEVDALIVAANAIGSAIQRQAMDDALKFSEEKFFRAFHSTPVLMTIEDASNHILDVNRAFLDTFEFKREQVLGHSVSDLNIIYELEELAALRRANKTDGKLKNFEIRFHLKNGQAGAALLSTDNFVVDNVSYTLTTGLDITDRKQADVERERLISELESKNEELERFTYTVSHDLKSPLVTINGFIGYLEQDAESGNMERLKKDTKRIQEAVFKMQTLLDELLELSRIGRLMDPPEDVPFEDLVKEALNVVQGRLDQRGVAVHTQPNLHLVHVDKPRLIEVLQNLLDNAAKYMGNQSNPYIEIGQDGMKEDKAIFFIKDNGMGIAPEHHDRIFGLFDKLDAKSEGTGVGLALVKRIIEVHGGSIWVQSEEGLGATFYFTLPTTREP